MGLDLYLQRSRRPPRILLRVRREIGTPRAGSACAAQTPTATGRDLAGMGEDVMRAFLRRVACGLGALVILCAAVAVLVGTIALMVDQVWARWVLGPIMVVLFAAWIGYDIDNTP